MLLRTYFTFLVINYAEFLHINLVFGPVGVIGKHKEEEKLIHKEKCMPE